MIATLYTTENPTVDSYRVARTANPSAVIPAAGEPWVMDTNGGLKVWAVNADNRRGWYYQLGDLFIPESC